MTTVEINYQIAKLRDERQQLLNRAEVISDCIQELAKLRTRQQLASKRANDERYEIPESLYEQMFGGEAEC
tara:strand:+ start:207 stop:419 length:213 start_codon:yes stop_codon:yes gene_type:complete